MATISLFETFITHMPELAEICLEYVIHHPKELAATLLTCKTLRNVVNVEKYTTRLYLPHQRFEVEMCGDCFYPKEEKRLSNLWHGIDVTGVGFCDEIVGVGRHGMCTLYGRRIASWRVAQDYTIQCTYRKGKLHGPYSGWSADGKIWINTNYTNDRQHGFWVARDELILLYAQNCDGERVGLWHYYNNEGKVLHAIQDYDQNMHIWYRPNGSLKRIGPINEKGTTAEFQKHGLWSYFDEYGRLIERMNLDSDVVHGDYTKFFPESGRVEVRGQYEAQTTARGRNGEAVGEWSHYKDEPGSPLEYTFNHDTGKKCMASDSNPVLTSVNQTCVPELPEPPTRKQHRGWFPQATPRTATSIQDLPHELVGVILDEVVGVTETTDYSEKVLRCLLGSFVCKLWRDKLRHQLRLGKEIGKKYTNSHDLQGTLAHRAVVAGDEVLKWLVQYLKYPVDSLTLVYTEAVTWDNLEIITWMHTCLTPAPVWPRNPLNPDHRFVSGYHSYRKTNKPLKVCALTNLGKKVVLSNDLEKVRLVNEYGCVWDKKAIGTAVMIGNIPILKWFAERLAEVTRCKNMVNAMTDTGVYNFSALNSLKGMSTPFIFRHSFRRSPFFIRLITKAVYSGRLNALDWLLYSPENVMEKPMNPPKPKKLGYWAARERQEQILRWAVEKGCPWDGCLTAKAIKYEDLSTFNWLISRENPCPCTEETNLAAEKLRDFTAREKTERIQ
jgi:antitoxin component YwqK of YwqJK toxin-antitoxin module